MKSKVLILQLTCGGLEKRISAHVSHERAKAYGTLTEHHNSVSDHLTGKDRSGGESSKIAEAEEDFCKSISTLVSTIITEGAKVPGECGAVLTSSFLCLVPTLPLDPVLTPIIDLPLEKECRITLGDCLMEPPCESEHREFPPQFTFNQRSKCPHGGWEIHH